MTLDLSARLTAAAHAVGAMAVWDLAHAAGNVPMALHDWNVDGAAWCTYKYMNSGPGAVGAMFVHERHVDRTDLVRLDGWWGNAVTDRLIAEHDVLPDERPPASSASPPLRCIRPTKSAGERGPHSPQSYREVGAAAQ